MALMASLDLFVYINKQCGPIHPTQNPMCSGIPSVMATTDTVVMLGDKVIGLIW